LGDAGVRGIGAPLPHVRSFVRSLDCLLFFPFPHESTAVFLFLLRACVHDRFRFNIFGWLPFFFLFSKSVYNMFF
jgi:hypothetical protein